MPFYRRLWVLLTTLVILALVLAACGGPTSTPIVIQNFSRENTLTAAARPSLTPTGPSPTPTQTSTPYNRPTDSPALDLSLPLVHIGTETITLGDFRARVRYERFAALEDVRRTIEKVGFSGLNFTDPKQKPTALMSQIAGVFATLANSQAFGVQIYNVMLRESILRQEFDKRGLKVGPTDARDYWIRRFGFQRDPDRDIKIGAVLDAYMDEAIRYSGMTRDSINRIAEGIQIAGQLRPLIAKERVTLPDVSSYRLKWLITTSQADANAASAALNSGKAFRAVACQYSADPAVRGNGGDLGFVARGAATLPLDDYAPLFKTENGTLLGPLRSAIGWYVIKVTEKRRTADNSEQVRVQAINVATESLATQIKDRVGAGEDFAALACEFSLGGSAGNGGDLGTVGESQLDPALVTALQNAADNQIVGPIQTKRGFEIAQRLEHKVTVPKADEVEKLTTQAFADWQTERQASAFVQPLNEAWQAAIPDDPLPRQVAPFLIEANFGLPTPAPTLMATPSPSATAAR